MIRNISLCIAFVFAIGLPTEAQEPAEAGAERTIITRQMLENPPEREINFERSADPHTMRLFRVDPTLLEQKFVAVIQFNEPPASSANADVENMLRSGPNAATNRTHVNRLIELTRTGPLGYSPFGSRNMMGLLQQGGRASDPDLKAYFSSLIESIPAEHRPSKDVVDFFTSDDIGRGYLSLDLIPTNPAEQSLSNRRGGRPFTTNAQFKILCPSPERGEALAAGLLYLLDWGVSRPITLELYDNAQALQKFKSDAQTKVESLTASLKSKQAEVDSTNEASVENAGELLVQRRLLQIELAGLKARLKACDKLLLQQDLTAGRREQVLNLKIAAEIELAGIEAKSKTLDEFIAEYRKRAGLVDAALTLRNQLEDVRQQVNNAQTSVSFTHSMITRYSPVSIKDDKVVIYPIKWTDSGR